MATNYIQGGYVIPCIAPAGGVVSGGLYAIGQLVVVAVGAAAAGAEFQGHTGGVWSVAATPGLLAGAKVSHLTNGLVADGTALSIPCGKLVKGTVNGFAQVRLSN